MSDIHRRSDETIRKDSFWNIAEQNNRCEYAVCVNIPGFPDAEILDAYEAWLNEQSIKYYFYYFFIFFKNEEDAIAFNLRWVLR